MAAITFTPASLARVSGPTEQRNAGEALIQGAIGYIKASDGKVYNAQCDGTAAEAVALCVVLTPATAAGQPVVIQRGGEIDVGAVLTLGVAYVLSATAGKCCPIADLVNPNIVTGIGYAKTTSRLKLAFCASAAVTP